MSERSQLQILLGAIDVGFCLAELVHNADGGAADLRLVEVNAAFEAMTGLRGAAGRRALELAPQFAPEWIETYARVAGGEVMRFEAGWPDRDRWFDVFATPVAPLGRFVVVLRDITERRRTEREREAARAEAERLLTEVNHRVMNTLAMIASIVRLEAQQAVGDDGPGTQALSRVQSRLAAVAVLYRALNSAAAVAEVQASGYLGEVVRAVAGSVADADRVRIDCDIASLALPTQQAAPLGLLVNELMTNALKYAFPDGRSGTIAVSLRPEGARALRLEVADDGVGLGDAGSCGSGGIGSLLVDAFTQQIGGTVVRRSGEGGTRVTVTFPRHCAALRGAAAR